MNLNTWGVADPRLSARVRFQETADQLTAAAASLGDWLSETSELCSIRQADTSPEAICELHPPYAVAYSRHGVSFQGLSRS